MADLLPGVPYTGTFGCDWCPGPAACVLEVEPSIKKDGALVKRAKVTYVCEACARRVQGAQPSVRAGRRSRRVEGQIDIFEALGS